FRSLEKELTEVEFEGQKKWVLRTDCSRLEHALSVETVRLLPAGDPFLASADRGLLVPQPRFRSELWPKSVWPGALLVNGELVVPGVGSWAESRCGRGDRWNPKSRKRSRTRSPACPSNRRRRRSVGRRAMCPVEQRRDRSFTRERCDRNRVCR